MKKNILFLVTLVIVSVVAFSVGDQHGMHENAAMLDEATEHSDETGSEHSSDNLIDEAQLRTSFQCDNLSSVIATFSLAMDTVTISSEGEHSVFPQVESPKGKKYEDANWSFLFRGETLIVTDKKNNTTTNCAPTIQNDTTSTNFGE